MSLGEMQACIARLCIDAAFRACFTRDQRTSLNGYALDEDELRAVCDIDNSQLDTFARSLERKREHQLRRFYPLMFESAEAEVTHLFARFYRLCTASPTRTELQDAVAFGAFVEHALAEEPDRFQFVENVARYERMWCWATDATDNAEPAAPVPDLGASLGRPQLREAVNVVHFDYDVMTVAEAQLRGEAAATSCSQPEPNWLVFVRGSDGVAARRFRINSHTQTVLALCDGSRDVAELVSATERAVNIVVARADVEEKLRRCFALNLLSMET